MIDPLSLLTTALRLASTNPTDTDIRRSISTSYYALFHHACVQMGKIVLRPSRGGYTRAWVQAFRHLDHSTARQRCTEVFSTSKEFPAGRGFPSGIVEFAKLLVDLQEKRHAADYDPLAKLTRADAIGVIREAAKSITAFDGEPAEAQRAFVVFLALRSKR